MLNSNFWENTKQASQTTKKLTKLKNILNKIDIIKCYIEEAYFIMDILL